MKFQITPGTPTYSKLEELLKKMREANEQARDFALSLGAKEWCLSSGPFVIAGGLSGFRFEEKPKGWSKVYAHRHDDVYFPQKHLKANQELIKQILALPLVHTDDFNKIVGYKDQDIHTDKGMIWSTHPGFNFKNGVFLLNLHEKAVYNNTNPDIVEITVSQFKKLSEGVEA